MSIWKPWHSRTGSISKSHRGKGALHRNRRCAKYLARFEPLEDRALLTSVAGDFNADGIADLAIGNPNASVNGHTLAGSVQIIYGTVPSAYANSDGSRNAGLTGLTTKKNLVVTKTFPGLNASPQANDQFGSALAAADFNGDGIVDLAIGTPGQSGGAGAVYILFGSRAAGLKTTGAKLWTQNSPKILGMSEAGDHFGAALAAGDFNSDHRMDLAIGVPNEGADSATDAGAVNVIYGADRRTQAQKQSDVLRRQWLRGRRLVRHRPGRGRFQCRRGRDLAIGSPGRTTSGNLIAAGAVNVLYGTRAGLQSKNMQLWTVGSGGVSGNANAAGQFGASLAAGDFNDDSRSDLVVGAAGRKHQRS